MRNREARPNDAWIQVEQVKLLYDQSTVGILVSIFNALAVVFVLRNVVPTQALIVWLSLVLLVCLPRLGLVQFYRRSQVGPDNVARWKGFFRIGSGLSALIWGVSAVILLPPNSLAHQVFIALVLGGMAVGAVAVFAADLRIFSEAAAAMLLPICIRLFLEGGETQYSMSLLIFLFMGIVMTAARHLNRSFMVSLRLRFENSQLVEELSTANQDLKDAILKARENDRGKSRFLAKVSHEIRTPLNGILGMSELLQRTHLDPKQDHYAAALHQSGKDLLRLLDDILDLSKIEAGCLKLEKVPFNPVRLTQEAVEFFAEQAQACDVRLDCRIDGRVPERLIGDPHRLRQIFLNLIGNALKFTEKGSVSVEVSLAGEHGRYVELRFQVTDTGVGVPEAVRERIFESFAQAESSTSRKFGGTGLGLSICKQLAQLMDGRIGVESSHGPGSCFWWTARFEWTHQASEIDLPEVLAQDGGPSGQDPEFEESHSRHRAV